MRRGMVCAALVFPIAWSTLPAQQAHGPVTFDVISVKRSSPNSFLTWTVTPNGTLRSTNNTVAMMIAQAYPPYDPMDIVGLPSWAVNERYDVSATSPLAKASSEERLGMIRGMLRERFGLLIHFDTKEVDAYALELLRDDGRLGSRLRPSDRDCIAEMAARRAAAQAAIQEGRQPDPLPMPVGNGPVPTCTMWLTQRGIEGDMALDALANLLRRAAGRPIVDRTGLAGSYRVALDYDRQAVVGAPDVAPSGPDALPSVFVAVREQLGLRLQSTRIEREIPVVDRIERPSEN